MKFPTSHCIPTSLLTKESYSDLICRLVSDGYVNLIPHLSYDLMLMWGFLGITEYGTIDVFNHPWSFLKINGWMDHIGCDEAKYPNILNKEFLEEYLN